MVLLISRSDVERAIDLDEIIDVVELAFSKQGDRTVLPNRIQLEKDDPHGKVFVMPGLDGASPQKLGLKVVTEFPDNASRGVPTTLGVIELYDPDTGALDALLDGTYITNHRTGAIGVVAARHLAVAGPRKVAVFGSGTQARHQVLAFDAEYDLDSVAVYSRSDRKHEAVEALRDEVAVELTAAETPEAAIGGADVVVAATTATAPVFDGELVEPGMLLVSIGSNDPTMCELPPAGVEAASRVLVDDYDRCLTVGDLAGPLEDGRLTEDRIAPLADVVRGEVPGREADDEVFVVKSVGSVLLDLYVASRAVEAARSGGYGSEFDVQGVGRPDG